MRSLTASVWNAGSWLSPSQTPTSTNALSSSSHMESNMEKLNADVLVDSPS